jgi:hypothetical protein
MIRNLEFYKALQPVFIVSLVCGPGETIIFRRNDQRMSSIIVKTKIPAQVLFDPASIA